VELGPEGGYVKLAPRQIDVLRCSAMDLDTKGTALRLFLGVETVKTHRHRAMEALDCRTWPGAVAKAIREGLV